MSRFARQALVAAVASAAFAGAFAAPADKLDVQLTLANPVVSGDVDIAVDVAVTNTTGHPVSVPRWQLPSDRLQGPLFRIVREDGTPAAYVGPLVKRAAARAKDLVTLEPGATLNFKVELTGAYQLGNGHYTIEYVSHGRRDADAEIESTVPLHLWTQDRTPAPAAEADWHAELFARPMAGSIGYTGNCTSTQKSQLASAVTAATNYATASNTYLAGTPRASQRYVKWFGAYTSARWSTAHTHFTNEQNAFQTKPLTLDCSCKDNNTYAYVYPDQPYKIYVCGAFWSAPMTGTDSKGGTLVHEMSHFTVVAGTDDWAYGQTAAANLARSNPTRALDNADNHEYFAENNPALP
jgi:peptidyl-Lys metalloendopeptidase